MVGSEDDLWIRFNPLHSDDGPGILINFQDEPEYSIGYCEADVPFTLPGTDKPRVWTVRKPQERLKLLCNGVQIFDFNFADSTLTNECRNKWALDFAGIKFSATRYGVDKASDFFRQFSNGKLFGDSCDYSTGSIAFQLIRSLLFVKRFDNKAPNLRPANFKLMMFWSS